MRAYIKSEWVNVTFEKDHRVVTDNGVEIAKWESKKNIFRAYDDNHQALSLQRSLAFMKWCEIVSYAHYCKQGGTLEEHEWKVIYTQEREAEIKRLMEIDLASN